MKNVVSYIEAEDVAKLIHDSVESFAIIDVRDVEEVQFDGQIKGPVVHIPSAKFSSIANGKDILRENNLLQKSIIAVHCHKSQQRGPYCARVLETALNELMPSSDDSCVARPEIKVLRYGYEGFFQRYSRTGESDELIHYPLRR